MDAKKAKEVVTAAEAQIQTERRAFAEAQLAKEHASLAEKRWVREGRVE